VQQGECCECCEQWEQWERTVVKENSVKTVSPITAEISLGSESRDGGLCTTEVEIGFICVQSVRWLLLVLLSLFGTNGCCCDTGFVNTGGSGDNGTYVASAFIWAFFFFSLVKGCLWKKKVKKKKQQTTTFQE
jgi:hypothetical protein